MRRVSIPFSSTQALNAESVGPAVRRNGNIFSDTTSRRPSTAPPSTRPCPSRYFVAEWMIRSAPSSSGRCSAGVQKQLSTTSSAPASCATSASAAMSNTSVSGLEGDSTNSSRVFGRSAARQLAGSVPST